MTRLPSPYRLTTGTALHLLAANFDQWSLESLPASRCWGVLEAANERKIGGGGAYDWLIAQTLVAAGPTSLLTLNPKHFADIDGLTVITP